MQWAGPDLVVVWTQEWGGSRMIMEGDGDDPQTGEKTGFEETDLVLWALNKNFNKQVN